MVKYNQENVLAKFQSETVEKVHYPTAEEEGLKPEEIPF